MSQRKKGKKTEAVSPKDSEGDFDVEKARYEVLKFGITNEKQRDKRLNAKQQLLVSLGAKVSSEVLQKSPESGSVNMIE